MQPKILMRFVFDANREELGLARTSPCPPLDPRHSDGIPSLSMHCCRPRKAPSSYLKMVSQGMLIGLLFLFGTVSAFSQALPPDPDDAILDEARVFPPEGEIALAKKIQQWEAETNCKLRVFTSTFVTGTNLREHAEKLTTHWMIKHEGIIVAYDRSTESHAIAPTLALWEKYTAPEIVEALRFAGVPFQSKTTPTDQKIANAAEIMMTRLSAAEKRRRLHQEWLPGEESRAALYFLGILIVAAIAFATLLSTSKKRAAARAARYYFPAIQVTERLGAPYGGGVIAERK